MLGAAIAFAAAAQGLDLTAFFTGRTHAENVLRIVFHRATPLIVDSVGHREGDALVIVDTVHEGNKPVRTRKWVMRPVGPNHFTGTLSDAIGPVDTVVNGNSATISYTMRDGGLKVVQQVRLQRDGTLSNHVIARKFGLKFARVDGTIRKLD
jgi:hypothetical protein